MEKARSSQKVARSTIVNFGSPKDVMHINKVRCANCEGVK